jgi:hypothetical protein
VGAGRADAGTCSRSTVQSAQAQERSAHSEVGRREGRRAFQRVGEHFQALRDLLPGGGAAEAEAYRFGWRAGDGERVASDDAEPSGTPLACEGRVRPALSQGDPDVEAVRVKASGWLPDDTNVVVLRIRGLDYGNEFVGPTRDVGEHQPYPGAIHVHPFHRSI